MTDLIPGMRYPRLEREFMREVLAEAANGEDTREHIARMEQRLADGAEEYGSGQFWTVTMLKLLGEIREELDDTVCWSALLSIRIREAGYPELAGWLANELRRVVPLYSALESVHELLGPDAQRAHYPVAVTHE